jgi:hypothetical protein
MMRIPVERLIDGVTATLLESVLPAMESRFARGQLQAAVDVLANLRDRVEEKPALLEAEARSLEEVLARLLQSLRAAEQDARAQELEAALGAAPAAPLRERTLALERALADLASGLDQLPPALADELRSHLGAHLGPQALRDVLPLKPSRLREISEG